MAAECPRRVSNCHCCRVPREFRPDGAGWFRRAGQSSRRRSRRTRHRAMDPAGWRWPWQHRPGEAIPEWPRLVVQSAVRCKARAARLAPPVGPIGLAQLEAIERGAKASSGQHRPPQKSRRCPRTLPEVRDQRAAISACVEVRVVKQAVVVMLRRSCWRRSARASVLGTSTGVPSAPLRGIAQHDPAAVRHRAARRVPVLMVWDTASTRFCAVSPCQRSAGCSPWSLTVGHDTARIAKPAIPKANRQ